jgi:hypothetical protein
MSEDSCSQRPSHQSLKSEDQRSLKSEDQQSLISEPKPVMQKKRNRKAKKKQNSDTEEMKILDSPVVEPIVEGTPALSILFSFLFTHSQK